MSRRKKLTRDRIAAAVESVRLDKICVRLMAHDRHLGRTPAVNKEAVAQIQELARLLVIVWDELCQTYEAERVVHSKVNGGASP